MGTELIRVEMDWTVTQAIREMRRQAEDVETVHSVYVVNAAGQLLGRLSSSGSCSKRPAPAAPSATSSARTTRAPSRWMTRTSWSCRS